MDIIQVNFTEYKKILPSPYNVFCTADFNELNRGKCETMHYLLFKGLKYRLGIIGGINNHTFFSPSSAPYGGFSFFRNDISIQYIEEAVSTLNNWAISENLSSINITLPPNIYNTSFITKQTNCLLRDGYEIARNDLNYHFNLDNFNEDYPATMWHNARSNLRIALTAGLTFEKCDSPEGKLHVYEIINRNKIAKGVPMRMQWYQIEETIKVVPTDFFLVHDKDDNAIASAIVFHASQHIVQIIYWGDLREYSGYKPMNYLSYKIFEYYKAEGMKIVDLGPSSDNSIPNYGLGEFKESIGCEIGSKLSFTKKID